MQHKNCVKTFRCTQEEAKWIAEKAEKNKMNESAYIRSKIFQKERFLIPAEATELLKKLNYYGLKIGTNINQVVRSCNSKKFITKEDYQLLAKYLEQINRTYLRICENIEQIAAGIDPEGWRERSQDKDGSDEAAADQGDEGK